MPSGLWRSGSASHWQCGGRGFESRQLHKVSSSRGGTAELTLPSPSRTKGSIHVRGRCVVAKQSVPPAPASPDERPKRPRYDHAAVEAKWQERWTRDRLYETP